MGRTTAREDTTFNDNAARKLLHLLQDPSKNDRLKLGKVTHLSTIADLSRAMAVSELHTPPLHAGLPGEKSLSGDITENFRFSKCTIN